MFYPTPINFKPEEILEYLRKSRSDDPLLSIEEVLNKHETILDEWAEKVLGQKIPEVNKFREVVSGETIEDRPEIQKVLNKIESPKYKAILIVDVQRLSRGDLEDAGRLIKLLRYTNTVVITPQKIYDLKDEYDRDSFERELKRGNDFLEYQKKIMNRGRLLSVSQGNFIASIPPYGFDKTWVMEGKRKCPTLQKNEDSKIVSLIFDLFVNKDIGVKNIANQLDGMGIKPPKGEHWASESIRCILTNIHYIGKVKWNYRKTVTVVEDGEIKKTNPRSKQGDYLIYDGRHEGFISEDLFNAAQEKLGRCNKQRPNTTIRNALAGLLYCQCGRAMSLRTYHNNGVERAPARLLCDDQSFCGTSSCLYEEVIDRVRSILEQCISDFEIKIKNNDKNALAQQTNIIKRLEQKLEDLNKKEISLWDKYTEEAMPKSIFDTLNEKILKERAELQESLSNIRKSIPDPSIYKKQMGYFQDALDALNNPKTSAAQKNKLLKICIERIEYRRDKSERQCRLPDEKKGTRLKTGANWSTSPIELEVKLRLLSPT